MADNLQSSTPLDAHSRSDHSENPSYIFSPKEESSIELPEVTPSNVESESENENQDEAQFLEQWRAHEYDEEYEETREERRAWRKECEDAVDLEEFMTARIGDDNDGDEEAEVDVEVEFGGPGRARVLAWMGYEGEAKEDETYGFVDSEKKEDGIWSNGDGEVEEEAELPQLRKIVQTIGKTAPNLAATCHRIRASNLTRPWIFGLNPKYYFTHTQATGITWALDRLEAVQGAILADAAGLRNKVTAVGVIMAQNNDRAAGKTLWGDAKPTLIVTSPESVETWVETMKKILGRCRIQRSFLKLKFG